MKFTVLLFFVAVLLSSCRRESSVQSLAPEEQRALIQIEPDHLTRLGFDAWIQAKEVNSTDLQAVTMYYKEGNGTLRIIEAESATFEGRENDIVGFTLKNASMKKGGENENGSPILMDTYYHEVQISPGWTYPESSPFDDEPL